MKIILILSLSLLLASCGFKIVNQQNMDIIDIQSINVIGEKRIGYSLKNNILLISKSNSKNKYDVQIKITKKKTNKIKDSGGKVTRYNLSIAANLELINLDNKKKIQRIFLRNADYNIAKIHSDTITNEKKTALNITKQLSEDIISFITLAMRNK